MGSPPSEMWTEWTVAEDISSRALPWPMCTEWSLSWPGFQGCSSGLWSGHLAATAEDRETSLLLPTEPTEHRHGPQGRALMSFTAPASSLLDWKTRP